MSEDLQYDFYERFFIDKGVEPYPVQEQALERIFAGESVLVTVPTGTGKTLMAKGALYRALRRGERAIYTTPLRALTEEKFRELEEDFGAENVGFATGDYKVRPEAPIQVLVAEILWNRILGDRVHVPADVVVMDEGHYFNDPERGYVWEQSIIGLDPRTQLVVLSATVGEADRFCQWVYLCRRVPMALVQSNERRVPLYIVDGTNTLVEATTFASAFPPCEPGTFPKKYPPGKTAEVCLVFLSPKKGDLTAVSFRPTQEYDPITWTGELEKPKPPKPDKPAKGDKGDQGDQPTDSP